MSNNSSSSSSSGIGCGGLLAVLLTVLFVGLKLTGYIAWSWVWVLSPIWIYILMGIAIIVLFFGGFALIAVGAGAISGLVSRHDKKKARERLAAQQERLQAERFAKAQPLGKFTSTGEKIEERKPHQWML